MRGEGHVSIGMNQVLVMGISSLSWTTSHDLFEHRYEPLITSMNHMSSGVKHVITSINHRLIT